MFWWVPWVSPAVAQTWWDDDWDHRAKLTFRNGSRDADLVDFPVLVRLADGVNFDHTLADPVGADLQFVDADGTTVLPYDIESWNVDGVSAIWVSVPRIDAGSETDHAWMYFGGPTATGERPIETWADSVAVWHLQPSLADATGGHPLWDDGSTEPSFGIVGPGRFLDGDDDQLKAADHPDFALRRALTISAWVAVEGWDEDYEAILTKGDNTFRLHRCGSSRTASFALDFDDDAHRDLCGVTPIDDGAWHQIVGVYDPDAALQRLYVDGVLEGEAVEARGLNVTADEVWIGNNQDNDNRELGGRVDEVRVAPVVRSAVWVSADQASVTDTFVTWCTPVLGLGDVDRNGICDEDDTLPVDDPPVDSAVPELPRTVDEDEPVAPIGCGCAVGPSPGLLWLFPIGWRISVRSGRGASGGSPGSRRRRARGRSASRATPPGCPES